MKNQRKHSANLLLLVIFIWSCVFTAVPGLSHSQSENNTRSVETLEPDYQNAYYKQVEIKIPGLRFRTANDLRDVVSHADKTTAVGVVDRNKSLVLSESVADFIKRSFETMLASEDEADRTIEIEFDIETFWLGHQKTSLVNNHIDFNARIGAAIVYKGQKSKIGWLEYHHESDVPSNVKGNQETLMYQGMATMARELARKIKPKQYVQESKSDAVLKPIDEPELSTSPELTEAGAEPLVGLSLGYHVFTGDLMDEIYGGLMEGFVYGGFWFKNRFGFRGEMSFLGASGTPSIADTSWTISSSTIKMGAVSLGGTCLYSLTGDPTSDIFVPYIGVGIDGIFGAEKISAEASRIQGSTEEEFGAEVWSVRVAFAGHAVLGTRIRATDKMRLAIEARWTQSGKGSNADLEEEELTQAFEATLYSAVKRSDFDFTGWSVHVGIEW